MNIYNITDASGDILSKYDINEMLEDLGISKEAIDEDTSEAIEADAEKNHIDLTKLINMASEHGNNEVSGSADTAKVDYENQLATLGIPVDVIAKGNDAIQAYALKNGIKLPSSNGTQLNLVS